MTNTFPLDPETAAGAAMTALQPTSDLPMPSDDAPFFLTEKELAGRWRLSARTLQRWRRARRGPDHVVLCKRILYPITGILAYEQRHLRHGGAS